LQRTASRSEDTVQKLRLELRDECAEHSELRRRLALIEEENQGFSARYVEVEQQNNDLANLYVASYRLQGSLVRGEVLDAIQEIIINLFEIEAGSSDLTLAASFGIDVETYSRIPGNTGLIGKVASHGEAFFATTSDDSDRGPLDENLTACIPLKVNGGVNGVIAIFRLLPQKEEGLGALDHEMLDLLSAQAGFALYCATLHSRMNGGNKP